MKKILESELREQAGSESYNRFEYQAHWIVYHMINEYKLNKEYLIFCEFHDDMAKTDTTNNCAEFFQIKTSSKFKEWTIARLFNRTKRRTGDYKHSFLGFIFYNFLKFNSECSKCHFVSNIGMDDTVATWQAIIEDNKLLKVESEDTYNTIKDAMLLEYPELNSILFEETFEKFVQSTFLYHGNLSLENYEKVVAGEFFQMLDNKDIYTSNSNRILRDIIEEVRKKSKHKIKVPISYKRLSDEKGISSQVFFRLKEIMKETNTLEKVYEEIESSLKEYIPIQQRRLIIRALKEHQRKLLDINDVLYQDTTTKLFKIIDEVLIVYYERIEELPYLIKQVHMLFEAVDSRHDNFNKVLVEAIFYERILG
ncbi:dsDNA nuclease domain-containing protein [Psychrobacillus sp. MER TA 171]|uniref:dsDNA nuclease domain-containing protein n=1 Tax=Psychrobacillus sp. MER TA 171 TaxID=2939577 RepID=UPI00203B91FA|nr:DUF4297 domain-containing protein [Psychrobacillus sp. MER TA 171]